MSNSSTLSMAPRVDLNVRPLGVALFLLVLGAWYLAQAVSGRQSALYIVGALLGVALYHAAFGFTSAWRVFIADGRGAGLRAQMVMLAVGVALFFPALAAGTLFGTPVTGLVQPAGTSVIVRAHVPLKEMFGYISNLRGMTKGRASFSMQFHHYDPVPRNIADEIMAKSA